MSNFSFLQDSFPDIFKKLKIAESRVFTESRSAANYIRLALEESIYYIYEEYKMDMPHDTTLANLIRGCFYENVIPSTYKEPLYIIRKTGNQGVHYGQKLSGRDVLISIQYPSLISNGLLTYMQIQLLYCLHNSSRPLFQKSEVKRGNLK